MPELPEVETVRLALLPALEHRCIMEAHVGRPDLRWPLPEKLANRLVGAFSAPPNGVASFCCCRSTGRRHCYCILACRGR